MRNKAAEICEKYLKKGDKVYVEGRIKTRKWQDDAGVERYSTEVQCTDFTFLTPKDAAGQPSPAPSSGSSASSASNKASEPAHSAPSYDVNDEEDDDLPF